MDLKTTIKEIISVFHSSPNVKCTRRDLKLPTDLKKVVAVLGVRRSGKTYLLFDTINRLVKKGIPKKHILYINFEDERLLLKQKDLDLVLQSYRELYPNVQDGNIWFFFDEIQNIEGWEKFVRRIHDSISKNVFITGSNSVFLSTDIATALRGRSVNFEVYPFSFDEYLSHLKIDKNIYLPKSKATIINKYYDYLSFGGFPETVGINIRLRNETLRNYFYVMLYKDLIERYKISSTSTLKRFIEKIAGNITKPFSVNKIYNDLHSQGLKVDKNMLYEISNYVENIYLSFAVAKFDYSANKRNASLKKMYFIDNGLLNALTIGFSANYGKLLENAVFLFLRKNYGDIYEKNIFYHNSKHECDFVICENNKVVAALQVSHQMQEKSTYRRELKGLVDAMKTYGLSKGYIITSEQEETNYHEDLIIEILPAYKIFMNPDFTFR